MKNYPLQVVLLGAVVLLINEVNSQLNANPTIPHHLLPCYRNPDIYTRENRYMSTFRNFNDLLRRIERSPSGRQKSAREIAMALLYHLRLDGIQPTPNIQQTQDITPFAPGGNNYYKHRLTLVGLLPKSNRPTKFEFLNESLTETQMCNLHFMLSYSIDPYRRENEDCSNIKFEDGNKYRQGYDSGYYGYGYDTYRSRHNPRYKRETRDEELETQLRNIDYRTKNLRQKLKRLRRALLGSRNKRSTSDREENLRSPDVEIIPVNVLETLSRSSNKSDSKLKKEEFTLGEREFFGPGEDHILRGGYHAPSKTYEGNLYKRRAMYHGDESSRVFIPNQQMSACPIENGVVAHKSGSITIGAVIAGIAAGLNYQTIPLSEFNAELQGPLAREKINNIWAATLAGNAADLILSLGLISSIREGVGLKGGWNNQLFPQWYMLEKGTPNYLTDVELRGALDGLWLGLTIEKYKRQMGDYPLSSILDMYYSSAGTAVDPNIKASSRGDAVTTYAPTEEFKKQLHLLSVVMKNQRVNTVTYTDFTSAVDETVAAINSYIPQISPRRSAVSFSTQAMINFDPKTDCVVVFDPDWDENTLFYYIHQLIEEELGATPGQSNLTLICPFRQDMVYNIIDAIDFNTNFKAIYKDCKLSTRNGKDLDYKYVFEHLTNQYSERIIQEHIERKINPYSFTTLLMLSNQLPAPDAEVAREGLERLQEDIPGIEVIVATNGPKEKFKELVVKFERDIFSLRTITEHEEKPTDLINRLQKVPRRISNPNVEIESGNMMVVNEGDAELIDDVRLGRVVIYKIDPFYIYDSVDIKIHITVMSHEVTVCHGREEVQLPPYMQRRFSGSFGDQGTYPEEDDDGKGNAPNGCKTGGNIVFDFEGLCDDADSVRECKPLFLSLQAPLMPKMDMKCVNCRFPTNVEYKIRVSGLTGNNTSKILISTSFLLLSIIFSRIL